MDITERSKKIIVTTDASGAYQAAKENMLVMIVDVIDMSTTLESALDAGAYAVLGCSPDYTRAPVYVQPEQIGQEAARIAKMQNVGVVLVAEPRTGGESDRIQRCQRVLAGLEKGRAMVEAIVPNLGAETPRIADFRDRVVVAVTDTGGVAFDAAFQVRQKVITGTVARTFAQRGIVPARTAVTRALSILDDNDTGIAVVAASRNSMEDVLAAQFIANLLMEETY